MQGQIRRFWRLRGGAAVSDSSSGGPSTTSGHAASAPPGGAPHDDLALPDPERMDTFPPEQPVLLMPSGGTRPVHVGELLPARQRRWPLLVPRLPIVPKRAILAAGVFAGGIGAGVILATGGSRKVIMPYGPALCVGGLWAMLVR